VSFEVHNVQKNKGGKYMHYGKVVSGELKIGDTLTATYNVERRRAIARAHSATHLLQSALTEVLGDHVHQAGSLVEPDHLRFDFTHFSGVTAEELTEIERRVNQAILHDYKIQTEEMPIADAKQKGATALFGEKYGDVVRVVDMGGYSMELCGGTHLTNSAQVGAFHIIAEFSVASGVRRMEAITGMNALEQLLKTERRFHQVATLFKVQPNELLDRLRDEMTEMKELRRKLSQYKTKESLGEVASFLTAAKEISGLKIITASRPGLEPAELRQIGDFMRDKEPNVVAVLATTKDEKLSFLAVCGKGAIAKGIKAGDLVRHVTAICGGKGGGKPDSAMGGGTDLLKMDDALASVDDFVSAKLS
ncbi:MAG: DHHA1 domain-containing protein, partial [Evtepia sp.]